MQIDNFFISLKCTIWKFFVHNHILSFFYVKFNIQNMALEGGSLSPFEAPSILAKNQHHSGKHVGYLPCVYTALPVISITDFTMISRLLL